VGDLTQKTARQDLITARFTANPGGHIRKGRKRAVPAFNGLAVERDDQIRHPAWRQPGYEYSIRSIARFLRDREFLSFFGEALQLEAAPSATDG
jgi:hypothetical protein